jgi:hypothetical protein
MSLKSYTVWIIINAVGLAYSIAFGWALFHPESSLHKFLLFLHIALSGTLLSIFFAALIYINWSTPSLDSSIWHGIGCRKESTMPMDMSIQIINNRMAKNK